LEIVKVAVPPLSGEVPMTVGPSLNCTWPVGPAGAGGVTVAVKVNDWVVEMGLVEVVKVVAVVPGALTVSLTVLEVLVLKLESPR
jgi:hypothetical protein